MSNSFPLLQTELTRRLGCRFPVIQTAMGWVADANLVIATTKGGGFGFLAGATIEPSQLEDEIKKVIEATGGSNFGLNFHMFQENAMQCVELAITYRLKAVSYGRGPDKETIGRLKAAGVLCIPTVGAVKHALKAIELGADMITIQGSEGGGHTGGVPTTILLPQVLEAVDVPVIAAGGFSTGRGLASALAAGAAGIAMGTRFMMTTDSPTPQQTMECYLAVNDPQKIRVTKSVDGMRHRILENAFIRKLESAGPLKKLCIALSSAYRWKRDTGMTFGHMIKTFFKALKEDPTQISQVVMSTNQPVLLQRSMVDGVPDEGILSGGQVAASINELVSAAELIHSIANEANTCLQRLCERSQPNQSFKEVS
ncbi:NAD(P)H-dependent flavin oxidoreductase YrpB (nitropropane dioxygenase family) [Marinobacterium halophilum]|uniref:NAD(P)H-dependent flavin oxidoreductase YrpB (Nitropropane dioxygenase family) n=1 Tax=Marinobacterium halophilum TaxID=267374 RepID=A0A2P8EH17_9GAMM|nr:nitronate monooxygenase [Marinobacterium halophilum]PSL08754.1 NAD(P)H-dependent flavin oxidoreductase YrpB (nitropropane dioxygenase family) [Marinobacterium halophilum]